MIFFHTILVISSVAMIALGVWMGRQVRESAGFFVAGRSLGPGLLFSTFLAANIGTGATVTATRYAYTDGLAAWWWNGSAGLGSLVLAFWVGPRMWREAKRLGLFTVGDFLEHHFGRTVRTLAAVIIWLGSFLILCSQLRGSAELLNVTAGLPLGAGAGIAVLITLAYFVRGGLLGAAWVNSAQLVVKLSGFLIVAAVAWGQVGSFDFAAGDTSFWTGENVGWPTLFLLGPAFFLSPGLIQKAYGARDEKALTRGVALNAVALMLFACLPVALGLAARSLHPGLERPDMALATVLTQNVPSMIGALGLLAVFYAQLSAADAVLFMLATSGARDIYRGLLRPAVTDAQMLRAARIVAVAGAAVGYLLTFLLDSVAGALTVFYQLMVVTLFAPILGGLMLPRGGRWAALASMLVGVATMLTTSMATGGIGYGWAAPHLIGLIASALTYLILAGL